jgi:hypothetical protein
MCTYVCVYIHTHGFLPVSACAYLCTCVLSYVQILVSSGGCGTMKIWAYLGSNLNILYYIIYIYIFILELNPRMRMMMKTIIIITIMIHQRIGFSP